MNKLLSFSLILTLSASLHAMENNGKNPVYGDDEEIAAPAIELPREKKSEKQYDSFIDNPADYGTPTATPSGTDESDVQIINDSELSIEEKKKRVFQLPFHFMDGFDALKSDAQSILMGLMKKNIGPKQPIINIKVSPDSRYCAVRLFYSNRLLPYVSTFRIIDLASMRTIHTEMDIDTVEFSPDSRYCATRSTNGTLRIIDLASMRTIHNEKSYNTNIATFSPDSKYYAIPRKNALQIVDLPSMRTINNLASTGHINGINREMPDEFLAFSPDSKYCATQSHNNTLRITHLASMRTVHTEPNGNFAQFSPDTQYLVTISRDRTLRIIDLASMRTVYTEPNGNFAQFSPDSQYLVTRSNDGTPRIIDFASMRTVYTEPNGNLVRFSPDSKYCVTTSRDRTLRIIDLASMRTVYTELDNNFVESFSPNSQYLTTKSRDYRDYTLQIIDLASMRTIYTEPDNQLGVFSPNSQYLVTTSRDRTLRIIDLASMHIIHTEPNSYFVQFSLDSKYYTSQSLDRTLHITDIETPQSIASTMNVSEFELLKGLQCAAHGIGRIYASPEQWATWQTFRNKLPEIAQQKLDRLICDPKKIQDENEFFDDYPTTACNIQ